MLPSTVYILESWVVYPFTLNLLNEIWSSLSPHTYRTGQVIDLGFTLMFISEIAQWSEKHRGKDEAPVRDKVSIRGPTSGKYNNNLIEYVFFTATSIKK